MNISDAQLEVDMWRGAIASIRSYSQSHFELSLLLRKPGGKRNLHLICGDCRYVCGPVVWGNASIQIEHRDADTTAGEIVVADKGAGFRVFCNGVRTISDVEPIY